MHRRLFFLLSMVAFVSLLVCVAVPAEARGLFLVTHGETVKDLGVHSGYSVARATIKGPAKRHWRHDLGTTPAPIRATN